MCFLFKTLILKKLVGFFFLHWLPHLEKKNNQPFIPNEPQEQFLQITPVGD